MNSRRIYGVIATVIVLLGLVSIDQVLDIGIGKKFTGFFSPVGVVVSSTGEQVGGFFGNIFHIGALQKENKTLNNRLDDALAEVARLSEAKKENDSLRLDLGFARSNPLDLVPADVAFFDPSLKDGITVRVADVTGIKVGNVALSQGYLIGRVSEINGKNVKILLTTDSQSSLPATLQGKDITGIAHGKIGNGLTMEQVPQSDNVTNGDIVVTSGLGGDLPKGLILGKVESVQKVSGSIFQSVILRPAVEFTRIQRVMIAR